MREITLWPEWVWAICNLKKDVENRLWQAPYSICGKRIAIHAGKTIGGGSSIFDALFNLESMASRAEYTFAKILKYGDHGDIIGTWFKKDNCIWTLRTEHLVRGSVVATAIVDRSRWLDYSCDKYADGSPASPWAADGQYNWILRDIIVLEDPVPCRGYQKLWTLKPKDEVAVRVQYER